MNRVYCLAEDRDGAEIGLRFAIASMLRVCPSARIVVYRPRPTPEFQRWLAGMQRVELIALRRLGQQQQEHDVDFSLIDRREVDGFVEPNQYAKGLFDARQSRVRDGNSAAGATHTSIIGSKCLVS